jgi:hypothetical protein
MDSDRRSVGLAMGIMGMSFLDQIKTVEDHRVPGMTT